jgi:hypothetical protein
LSLLRLTLDPRREELMERITQTDSRLARLADVVFIPITTQAVPNSSRSIERRNVAARRALNYRVREEFVEMPGTCLTLAQAARLFGIPRTVCRRIFDELISDGKLRQTTDSRYRLHSAA